MAQITFGAATSHTPYLLAADETLTRFLETDQANPRHRDKEGHLVTYGELLEKADPKLAGMVAPQHLVERQNVARAAVRTLRERVAAANIDTLIVLGDDQNESYKEDCRPAFAIYYGDTILNDTKQHTTYSHLPEWYVKNRSAFFELEKPRHYPVNAKLAEYLIGELMDADFDVAASHTLPPGEGEGHAVAYIHRHVMDAAKPIPVVPIFLNTYYEPNRPRPRRCYALGQAIRKAVEKFPGNERVGICASGGLSHFLVDEDFDRAILKALGNKDAAFLKSLPWNKLHAGSSEILNWVGIAGALEHLDLTWFEYVPGYRTPAGTGTGMSFATWA